MRITVSHNLSRIAQSLSRLSGKLTGSLEEPLRAIGGILESSTRRRIAETKTAPDGKRWAEVSPATAQAKNGRGGILVDHGNLLASITHEASAKSVITGSIMGYSVYVQEGTKTIPARPFLASAVAGDTSAQRLPSGAVLVSAIRRRVEDSRMPPMARKGSSRLPVNLPDRRFRLWAIRDKSCDTVIRIAYSFSHSRKSGSALT